MILDSEDDKLFFNKLGSYIKIASHKVSQLDEKVSNLEDTILIYRKKQASDELKQIQAESSLQKAALALYNADHITDESEKRKFLKLAKENPAYLADILVKVCNASDVATLGKTARASSKSRSPNGEYDPVHAKAFGYSQGQSSILDD